MIKFAQIYWKLSTAVRECIEYQDCMNINSVAQYSLFKTDNDQITWHKLRSLKHISKVDILEYLQLILRDRTAQ